MGSKVTLQDVAREAGVGVITASRAVRGIGKVHPKTRKRVLEAVERLGYARHTGIVFSTATRPNRQEHRQRLLLSNFTPGERVDSYIYAHELIDGLRRR